MEGPGRTVMHTSLIALALAVGQAWAQDVRSGGVPAASAASPHVAAAPAPAEHIRPARLEIAGPPSSEATGPPASADRPGWDFSDHPRLVLGRDSFVDFRVKVQWDHRTFSPLPDDPADDTDWALRRVGVEGQVTRFVEFEVSAELGDQEDPWRAVFVNLRPLGELQVQGGHFKVPFSRERLTGPSNLDFTQRAIGVRVVAPGYDTGVMAHGRAWKRRLGYAVGVFSGKVDRAGPAPEEPALPGVRPLQRYEDQLWAWRVTGRPFAWKAMPAWLRPLELGANAAYSHVDEGVFGWRARAVFGQDFFPSIYYVNGRRTRYGVDAALVTGPVAIQWEHLIGLDERLGQGMADDDLPELEIRSWYVSATIVVTGERKSDVERPRRPLLRGGIGAVEAAARVERLSVGSRDTLGEPPSFNPRGVNVLGNSDTVWTVGVNWYPGRFLKVQVNAIRERLEDPERTLLQGYDTFWSYVVRLQFVL